MTSAYILVSPASPACPKRGIPNPPFRPVPSPGDTGQPNLPADVDYQFALSVRIGNRNLRYGPCSRSRGVHTLFTLIHNNS